MKKIALIAFVAVATTNAFAANLLWTGNTTGAPTFNRLSSLTTLSGAGTAVAYEVQEFNVTVSGNYIFEADYTNNGASASWDGYLHLYANSFNPATPLVNIVGGDDDYVGAFSVLSGASGAALAGSQLGTGLGSSFGNMTLTAGISYFAVVTGFGNTDFGAYRAGVGGGQGDVLRGAPVPEPASMIILGGMALAAAAKRRKK